MIKELLDSLMFNMKVSNMNIDRISIGGFRNVEKSELIFNHIFALVSLNSYGKSNLLNGIRFGIDFIKNGSKNKKKMMSNTDYVPLNKKTASKDYLIELEMNTTIQNKNYKIIYGYDFKWVRNDNSGAKINNEWLRIKNDNKNQKYNNYITRTEDKAFYRTSESGRCSNKIKIESNELVINKILAYDSLFYLDIVEKINDLNMYIERHLDASFSYKPLPQIIRSDNDDLIQMDDIFNIPRVIYYMKKQYPDKFEMLKDSFMLLFPSIININVSELDKKEEIDENQKIGVEFKIDDDLPLKLVNQIYSLEVIDENINQPINFDSISDGAKRVFLILTSILLADIRGYSLIAIEEPENSVHPALLQKYLQIISQFSVDCKVIITSHSPYILQYINPQNIYIGIPNANGIAKFSRIRQSSQKIISNDAKKSGVSVGDYIFELLSGADNDIESLSGYLED